MRIGLDPDGYTFFPMFDKRAETPRETNQIFRHNLDIVSAYRELQPFPTFFAPKNVCTVDYIFLSRDLRVVRCHMLPENVAQIGQGIPNALYPSDHFSLTVEITSVV
jgi:endonuclease/exonuclease/phosphatase family metal-dependent hydrolase